MKKIYLLLLTMIFFLPSIVFAEEELKLAEKATSAIMIEASTGEILYSKNPHEKLAPASMTKIMSLLLIMENLENGKLKWDQEIKTSDNASSMGGSQIFLEVGETMKVNDLIKAICIGSANDATVSLAEAVAGTEEKFVKLMNKKAQKLGLKNTNFKNATGLDEENHYSSAYDMSIMAKELIKYSKILEFTKTYETYLRNNSFWLVNTNKLVRYYSGVDGLKTGYTSDAGYCLTATANKNGMRLITVVMNEPSGEVRSSETSNMLDYGYNMYSIKNLINKEDSLGKIKINLGDSVYANLIAKENVNILSNKTEKDRIVSYKIKTNQITAPIKKGDKVGEINVIENNKTIMTIDLTIDQDIKKSNIFKAFYRNLMDIINGNVI